MTKFIWLVLPVILTGWLLFQPESGRVTGKLCYPGSETPPLTLYLENQASADTLMLDVPRGQATYAIDVPPGAYIAYALTNGMGLRGAYTCDGKSPCVLSVEAGETVTADLCDWYGSPGIQPGADVTTSLVQTMHLQPAPHWFDAPLDTLSADTEVEVIGRNAAGDWLHVTLNADTTGWLYRPLLEVTGDPLSLPVESNAAAESRSMQFEPAIWRSEANAGMVLFHGEIRDTNNRPVNGYSILLENGTWWVLSHPAGASRHYPEAEPGAWDIIINNATDAAGWWAMTVVSYDCPNFEQGFNARCEQFTRLSETKLVKVVHPDDNILETNWTCLEDCAEGVFVKSYRRPPAPMADNFILYIEDRALKSSPHDGVFEHRVFETLYDDLPDTPDGLRAYLAQNRPVRSADGRYLLVNDPDDITWLADLSENILIEVSRPAVPAAWSPTEAAFAYLKADVLYTQTVTATQPTAVWTGTTVMSPTVVWSENGLAVSEMGRLAYYNGPIAPDILHIIAELPPDAAWAISRDGEQLTYSLSLEDDPLTNEIYLYQRATGETVTVGPIDGYRVPELRWSVDDTLILIGATNPKFPSGGAIFAIRPLPDQLPTVLLESDTVYLVDVWPDLTE